MKRIALLVSFVALLAIGADTNQMPDLPPPPQADGHATGRFTLAFAPSGRIFRIDTCTGATWEYLEFPGPNKVQVSGWTEMDEGLARSMWLAKHTQPSKPASSSTHPDATP